MVTQKEMKQVLDILRDLDVNQLQIIKKITESHIKTLEIIEKVCET